MWNAGVLSDEVPTASVPESPILDHWRLTNSNWSGMRFAILPGVDDVPRGGYRKVRFDKKRRSQSDARAVCATATMRFDEATRTRRTHTRDLTVSQIDQCKMPAHR